MKRLMSPSLERLESSLERIVRGDPYVRPGPLQSSLRRLWQVTYNFYGAVDQKVVFADVDKFIRLDFAPFIEEGLIGLTQMAYRFDGEGDSPHRFRKD
jgi:hypothetical protein